jgi:hypothetical protein
MNVWGWLILFVAVILAVAGFYSSVITIINHVKSLQHPQIKKRPTTASIIAIIGVLVIAVILTPVSFAVGRASTSTSESSPTATNQTPTPTITQVTFTPSPQPTTPTPPFLYRADFSQGSQGWLDSNYPPQWTYNASDKALESDGSLPCCTPVSTLANVVLVAPYMPNVSDYAIEARIKITGLNQNHPYSNDQPPFFGLYARGDGVNGQGYMAGIGWIYATPNGKIGANGPFSYLIGLGPNPAFYSSPEKGAEKYGLDTAWHTYRLEVKGNTFMLKIDNKPVYSHIIQDSLFATGLRVGLENYNCLLQVQSITVYPIKQTP